MTFEALMLTNCGYETKTTFWMDFSIADTYGVGAIKDTFKRTFEAWRSNYVYLTELVIVLNYKIWAYYEKNEKYCELYTSLYDKARDYALDNLKDEELSYYLRVTD